MTRRYPTQCRAYDYYECENEASNTTVDYVSE